MRKLEKKPTRIVVKECIIGDIFRVVVLLNNREKASSYSHGVDEGQWNSEHERVKNMVVGRATIYD